MPNMRPFTPALLAAVLIAATGTGCRAQLEDVSDPETFESTAVTVWTTQTEVFFEYPPLVAGAEGGAWAVHVTRLLDFSPVTEGSLIVSLRGQDGRVHVFEAAEPVRPGIFLPSPSLPVAGVYDSSIEIRSPQLSDVIDTGRITVFASEDDITSPIETGEAIAFLKEQQWPIDFGVAVVAQQAVARSVLVSGTILPAAGAVAEVASPVSGLLLAASNLRSPIPGDPVREGDIVAVISPTGGTDSFADAKARVERLRREADRLSRLFAVQAIPENRLIAARHDLEIAESSLATMGGGSSAGYNYQARSPIAGWVQERTMVVGAHVSAGDRLFTIVDSRVMWLRLNMPARMAADAGRISEVEFTVESGQQRFRSTRVVSIGAALDPDTRTLPVILSVDNGPGRLKSGMYAEGRAFIGGETAGLAVPQSAVQIEDGQPVVYVQTGGESFERRRLELGAADGTYTIVLAGLEAGEYVVTAGAYQVYLASLNTSELGEGHAH